MINGKFERKIKLVAPAFFLFLTTYVMYIPIRYEVLCLANALFSKLLPHDPTNLLTLIFVSITGWSIVKFTYEAIANRRYVALVSLANFSLLFFTYLLFRLDDKIYFYKLGLSSVAISDVLFFFLFVLFSDYEVSNKPLIVAKQFIIEDDVDESNDLFGRERYADKVVEAINSSVSSNSIGISINAEWGYGKTFFLRMIKSKLSLSDENIIIWFNPWDRERGHASIDLFFDQLEAALRPFNSRVTKKIRTYTENILRPEEGDTLAMNLIRRTVQIVIPAKAIDEQKEELSKIIIKTGKRIIVFVDDLDRLSGEEIAHVMQLIRNSAGFKNTFFIVALDRSYVSNALPANEFMFKSGAYLEKIFQIEILLPPVKVNARKILLKELFSEFYGPESVVFKELVAGVEVLSSDPNFTFSLQFRGNIDILESYLENIRDVKRFFNSFNLAYSLIQGDVDIDELLLLELIKYKSASFYRLIACGDLLEQADIFVTRWQFSETKFDKLFADTEHLRFQAIPNAYMDTFKRTLYYLYPRAILPEAGAFSTTNEPSITQVNQSSVVYRKNHSRYFNYNLFGDFSIVEFKKSLSSGIESVFEYVDVLSQSSTEDNGNPNSIKNYLRYLELYDFKTLPEYKLGINSFFFAIEKIDKFNIENIFTDLMTRSKVVKYFGDLNDFIEINTFLLEDIIVENRIKIRERIDFLFYFIHLSTRSDFSFEGQAFNPRIEEMILKYKELLDIQINQNMTSEEDVYYSFVRGVNLGILGQEQFDNYKNYLNSYPSYFLKMALFPLYEPRGSSNVFKFFGYRQEVFGNDDGFKDFLLQKAENLCAQYILAKFKDFENLDSDVIEIDDYDVNSPCQWMLH